MQYSKYSLGCCFFKRPHKYIFFSWTICHTTFNTFSMLPLWISDLSSGLGLLGGKIICIFTLTLVWWNIPEHITRLCYYTQKYYSRKGEWQIQSRWAARDWSVVQQVIQSAPDKDENRKGAWSGCLHSAPIFAVFLVIALLYFQVYSFTVSGTKPSQCCSLTSYKQRWTFI